MPRYRYDKDLDAIVEIGGGSNFFREIGTAPYVISDEMPALRHMGDGNHYTSKAKFRQATKDAGCVEIGNENVLTRPRKQVGLDRKQRREDIRRAIHDLRDGRAPRMEHLLDMAKRED